MNKRPLIDGKGTYQLNKIEMVLRHTPGRRTAIDIGAHVGTWARVLAKEFALVQAFEPVPEHIECFELNVTSDNVLLHQTALGAAAGMERMTLYPGNSGHSHIGAGDLSVSVYTLDSFEITEVDLIKIDCEGYELPILKGAEETLERWRPTLIVEQKPGNGRRYGNDDQAAIPWLERKGFKMVAKHAGDYIFAWN